MSNPIPLELVEKLKEAKERLDGVPEVPQNFPMQPAEALQLQLLQERRRSLNLEVQLINEQEARFLEMLGKKYGVDMTKYNVHVSGNSVTATRK